MKIRVAVTLMLLVILTLALASGFVLIWRLLFAFVAMLLISYFWSVLHVHGISVRVGRLPDWCQVGESFDEEFVLANKDRWPKILLKVQEKTDLPGQGEPMFLSVPGAASVSLRNKILCQRRGSFELGSLGVTASGLFGLFSQQRHFGEPRRIMVYPETHMLPHFEILRGGNSTSGAGSSGEFSPNASTIREYQAGDNRRHVHWQSTVRTGKLQVKVFDRERTGRAVNNVWVILDVNAASFQGDEHDRVEECCMTVAASLVRKHLESGVPTGFLAQAAQSYLFTPEANTEQQRRVMSALALMKPNGDVFLADLIQHHAGRFGMNSALVVVSPVIQERLTASLRRLSHRVGLIVVVAVGALNGTGDVSAESVSRMASLTGLPVYLVFPGDDLALALDSRNIKSHSGSVRSAQLV